MPRRSLLKSLLEDLEGQKAKRAEFIEKTYGPKWGDGVPGYKKIDKFIADLAKADPSRNGMYMPWMAKLIIKNPHENHPEDLGTISDELTRFESNKSKIQNKDINSYKSFSELYTALAPLLARKDTPDEKEKKERDKAALAAREQSISVYSGPEGWIRIPETKSAAIYYGQNTKWCTAGSSSYNAFDSYNKSDKLFVIYDKTVDPAQRLQLHIDSNQLANVMNGQVGMGSLPKWAGKQIAQWYKANVKSLKLKHVLALGVHDDDLAKGTDHEDVVALMKKYGV